MELIRSYIITLYDIVTVIYVVIILVLSAEEYPTKPWTSFVYAAGLFVPAWGLARTLRWMGVVSFVLIAMNATLCLPCRNVPEETQLELEDRLETEKERREWEEKMLRTEEYEYMQLTTFDQSETQRELLI